MRRTIQPYRARDPEDAMKQVFLLGTATIFLLCAACGSPRANPMAYVANNDQSSISIFHVDSATGMLTLVKAVDAPAGSGATYCEMHPSGRFLFVSGQFT